MRLRAERPMAVSVRDLGLVVEFAAWEEMRTEISAKFRPDGLAAELAALHLRPERTWVDPQERFALILAVRCMTRAVRTRARAACRDRCASAGPSARMGSCSRRRRRAAVGRRVVPPVPRAAVAGAGRARPPRHGPAAAARHPGLRFARLLGTGRGGHRDGRRSEPGPRSSRSGRTRPRSPPSRTAGSRRGRPGAGAGGEVYGVSLALLSGHGRWVRTRRARRPAPGRDCPSTRKLVLTAPASRSGRSPSSPAPPSARRAGTGSAAPARPCHASSPVPAGCTPPSASVRRPWGCRPRSASGPTRPRSPPSSRSPEHRAVVRRTREEGLVRRGAVRPVHPAGLDGHLGRPRPALAPLTQRHRSKLSGVDV
jgi:hypothetical protein